MSEPKKIDSPFLPGTQIQFAWDSTSLGYLKTCPRLYQYTMLDGWSSRDEPVHLRFGIEFHSALQGYDVLRAKDFSHEESLRGVLAETLVRIKGWDPDQSTRAGNYKNPHTLISLIVDYLDHFKDDAAKTYILADGRPAVELSFRFELDWGPKASNQFRRVEGSEEIVDVPAQPYLLSGHLDRVVHFNDGLYVMDHKTTMTTPSQYYFAGFSPNNQMTLYTIASGVILENPIKGVIIDACQILLEKPNYFTRGFTFRTQDNLDEWLADLRYWFAQAEAYATANYWPMNDTACDKFGGCKFREVCAKSPSVREQFLKGKFDKLPPEERWNPLRSRT